MAEGDAWDWKADASNFDPLGDMRRAVIADAIAYLKTTPAVLLAGKGGGYELLTTWAERDNRAR